MWAIYASAGQSVRGALALLVEAPIYDEFVSRFAGYAQQLKVGDPLDPETQIGSLISTSHRDRVHGFVERGARGGRRDLAGGATR